MKDALINIGVSAARRAGTMIAQSFERLDRVKISQKSDNDLVTDVDVIAEQMIIETIREAYPDHKILAEESGEQPGHSDVQWIIDPLDGTNNFAHGFPHFAISIAVKQDGKITHGIILDPLRDEIFTATKGGGAYLNNRRIRVTECRSLGSALLGTGFPFRHKHLLPMYMRTLEPLAEQATGIRRAGSAALDLAYVASGRFDGFWDFALQPWDIAAGTLLVKEAGGMVSDNQGLENYLQSGNVVATNRKLFKEMIQITASADR